MFLSYFSIQIHETVETINQLKIQREFMLGFARDPQQFISQWLVSQSSDLKVSTVIIYLIQFTSPTMATCDLQLQGL